MTKRVTKRQAEAALAAVKKKFDIYLTPWDLTETDENGVVTYSKTYPPMCPEPKLSMDWEGNVAILWEDGPSEWAYRASMGGTSEEDRVLGADAAREFGVDPSVTAPKPDAPVSWPEGVTAEPYYSFVLCLYLA